MSPTVTKKTIPATMSTEYRANIVRTMFFLYSVLIVGGIVFFVTVGLTQQ